MMIEHTALELRTGLTSDCLWSVYLRNSDKVVHLSPPILEIDGEMVLAGVQDSLVHVSSTELRNGIVEHTLTGVVSGKPELSITLILRTAADARFVRFRYKIASKSPCRMTKSQGIEKLQYLKVDLQSFSTFTEVRFSEFNELFHSFILAECPISPAELQPGIPFMGPMFAASGEAGSLLLAYEHGSQFPDRFLEFAPTQESGIAIRAVKGNYYAGRVIDLNHPYETVWFQVGCVDGDLDSLRGHYRQFQLAGVTSNAESRKPYIFYNTWNFQERNQGWYDQTYLQSMNQQRMLDEIDVAQKMGVDVFVLDTGWYDKTGDWRVSRDRFPNTLKDIKAKLDSYGMKLGLWFNPTVAARSSRMAAEHDDCVRTWKGARRDPSPVWETEESWDMCLVSRYWQAFADELIRLHDELGVVYFKWDAIGQYGCSDAKHDHGKDDNSYQERSECYAFEIGGAMAAVVDKLGEGCPDAIVDFDITEGGRTVGLSFLSAGKYFLINNGPYYGNYDIPAPPKRNINMFFYPGPARGWICRAPLTYDTWFPSTLFLTHYFPDDPAGNQWITLASLMLGQNGIWGDLLTISDEGVQRFGEALARYKVIRDDITAASLVKNGQVGGGLEVYEKISENGRGIVSLFSTSRGEYTYVTKSSVEGSKAWSNGNVHFLRDGEGRAVITATLDNDTAGIVLFGID